MVTALWNLLNPRALTAPLIHRTDRAFAGYLSTCVGVSHLSIWTLGMSRFQAERSSVAMLLAFVKNSGSLPYSSCCFWSVQFSQPLYGKLPQAGVFRVAQDATYAPYSQVLSALLKVSLP